MLVPSLLFLVSALAAVNANFDEDYARKMLNFAAAAFVPSSDMNRTAKALQCFEKSYPNGGWELLGIYEIHSCAQNYVEECRFMVARSQQLKMIVISVQGIIAEDHFFNQFGTSLQDYIEFGAGLGKMNKFFYGTYSSMWLKISAFIRGRDDYKIAFTGHSAGGAFASLLALKARSDGIITDNQMNVYTFGEVRVGDAQLAQSFNGNIGEVYRVIHYTDIVPHMPICDNNFNNTCISHGGKAVHHAQEIWYNSSNLSMNPGEFVMCNKTNGEDPSCSNSINPQTEFHNNGGDRTEEIHIHYYGHKLDEYGPNGCS